MWTLSVSFAIFFLDKSANRLNYQNSTHEDLSKIVSDSIGLISIGMIYLLQHCHHASLRFVSINIEDLSE